MTSQLTWNNLAYYQLKHLLVDPKKLHPNVGSQNADKDDDASTSAAMSRCDENSMELDDTVSSGQTLLHYTAETPDDEYVLDVDWNFTSQNLVRQGTLVNGDVARAMAVADAQDVGAVKDCNVSVDRRMSEPYDDEGPVDEPPPSPTVASDEEDTPVPPSSPKGRRELDGNTADLSSV